MKTKTKHVTGAVLAVVLGCFTLKVQAQHCPRIWQRGDTLFTDPAPQIQWLRDGQPIPQADQSYYLPPPNERATYSVIASGQPSRAFRHDTQSHRLSGYVIDENYTPVEGATVKFSDQQTQTQSDGSFVLPIGITNPDPETPLLVQTSKDQHWDQVTRIYPQTGGSTQFLIQLTRRTVTHRFDAQTGAELIWNGLALRFPPQAIQTAAGVPFAGRVHVTATTGQPREPTYGLRVPGGDLTGIDASSSEPLALESFGFWRVELHDSTGTPLELRAPALLRVPVSSQRLPALPDSLPLWHFDPNAGTWHAQRMAYRNANVYEGLVTHFSDWLCANPARRATIRGSVRDCNGALLSRASLRVGPRWLTADPSGNYWCHVPANLAFDIRSAEDSILNVVVPPRRTVTMRTLISSMTYDGWGVWNPLDLSLEIYLTGQVPSNLRFSIDNGQTWTSQRRLTNIRTMPLMVRIQGRCNFRLPVVQSPTPPAGCQRVSPWHNAPPGTRFQTIPDALLASSNGTPVYWLSLNQSPDVEQVRLIARSFPCLVNIETNDLDTLPETLGDLVNLARLRVHFGKFGTLPESMGNLVNLEEIFLNIGTAVPFSMLQYIPQSIGQLKRLKYLGIGGSSRPLGGPGLRSIPSSIAALDSLELLQLGAVAFSTFPAEITQLRRLKFLGLYGDNATYTTVPASIANLTSLETLHLDAPLIDLPDSIGNLSGTLTKLTLHRNRIPPARRAQIQALLPNTRINW